MIISKENMKYSLKNLQKQKGRSALTIFSILIGITTIFIFLSFGLGLYNYTNSFITGSSADKITITPKGIGAVGTDSTFALTEDDLRAVKQTSGVYEAQGMAYKVVEMKKGSQIKYVFLAGMEPEDNLMEELSSMEVYKGRRLTKNDQGVIMLGYNYMIDNKIFNKGLDINSRVEINGETLRVVGFYDAIGNPQDDANVYVNLKTYEALYPNGDIDYNMIVARVDISGIDLAVENIEKSLRRTRNVEKGQEDFYVASFEDMLASFSSALNTIIGFIMLIAFISIVVSSINTANTMITSVLERYKEIGIIKSIGARNSEIFKIFLFESSFLGLVAGIIGVLFGFIFVVVAGALLDSLGWGFLQPAYPWYLFLGCILFSVFTGAISGVVPAMNASKINPVDALRYE